LQAAYSFTSIAVAAVAEVVMAERRFRDSDRAGRASWALVGTISDAGLNPPGMTR